MDFEEVTAKMTKGALGDQEKFILLTKKTHPKMFMELRSDRLYKSRCETYDGLKVCLLEKSQEDCLERHLQKKVFSEKSLHVLQESPQDTEMTPATPSQTPAPKPQFGGKGKISGKGSSGKGGFVPNGKGSPCQNHLFDQGSP